MHAAVTRLVAGSRKADVEDAAASVVLAAVPAAADAAVLLADFPVDVVVVAGKAVADVQLPAAA